MEDHVISTGCSSSKLLPSTNNKALWLEKRSFTSETLEDRSSDTN